MVTHDVDEALSVADRLILMTDGPEATFGDVLTLPFPRPRRRAGVLDHPEYYRCRKHVIAHARRALRGASPTDGKVRVLANPRR